GVMVLLAANMALATGQPATAKARLVEAKAAAAQWQKDAVLVTVSSLQTAPDGTAPLNVGGWVYTFYAKKAKKWAGFHAGPQGLERVELPAGLTEPLPAAFVDSDAVLTEVRKHGFQKQGKALLSLMPQRDPNLKPGVYWCAAGEADLSVEQGMRGYCVDPATGKFVARMAGGTISAPSTAQPAASTKEGPAGGGGGVLAGLDPAQCGGFSAADAAAILEVPAGGLTRRVEQVHGSLWSCSFAAKDGKQVLFSIEVAKGAAEAAEDMEQYRNHLGDNYSDLMGLGDEGVWTEVNQTVTYRKQNVTIQVQQPPEKIPQLKVVKAFFDKN
ncbi:MAG: hypothetical protein IH608_11635, partial [Proteobacteria bacterium]|nr:hypothetical protein [Pseudomonadota bacterium]